MVEAATLLGSTYTALGEVGSARVGPHVSMAISRGRFPKGYPFVDPNEDAAFAAVHGPASLLMVADGHNGFDAALAATEATAAGAPDLLEMALRDPGEALASMLAQARAAVTGVTRKDCGTALSVVVAAEMKAAAGTFGDTSALLIRRRRARPLTAATDFLRAGEPAPEPAMTEFSLNEGDRIALLTDGVTDFVRARKSIAAAVRGVRAEDHARALVELGFAGGAGDNLAAVVFAR